MFLLRTLFVLFVSLCLPAFAYADLAVPPLKSRVTDLTGTLTGTQQEALAALTASFEAEKGGQIAVLMIPSLNGEALEDYSIKVAEQWKIGRKGSDDGVILLIAKNDRKMRIEVGYGYEGALTDVETNRIIREIITPKFKQGDFYGGINDGLIAIIGQVKGEELPPPKSSRSVTSGMSANTVDNLFFVFIAILVSSTISLRKSIGRVPAALLVGIFVAVICYIFTSVILAALGGGLSFLLSLFYDQLGGGRSGYIGGSSSGGFSSSSRSGGGFSGGGGGFGGGGSSGSW